MERPFEEGLLVMGDIESYQSNELQTYNIPIPGWEGIRLPIVQTPDRRLWWLVRAICETVFGIDTSSWPTERSTRCSGIAAHNSVSYTPRQSRRYYRTVAPVSKNG